MESPTIYLYDTTEFSNRFLVEFMGVTRDISVSFTGSADEYHKELGEQVMAALAEIAEQEQADLNP